MPTKKYNLFYKFKLWFWYKTKVKKTLNIKIIKSNNKNSPQVVLLHGIASNMLVWNDVVSNLKGKYNIVLIDLLGFGKSPKPDDIAYNADQHAYLVYYSLKKARAYKPSVFIGHSMGAIIATRFAVSYPKNVTKLELCSLPIYRRSELTDKKLFAWQRETDNLYFRLYGLLRHKKDFSIKTAQVLRKMGMRQVELNEQSWLAFRNSLQNTIENQNVEVDIRKIKVPIRIIYGKFDFLLISKHLKSLAKYSNVFVTQVNAHHDITKRFAKEIVTDLERTTKN